MIKVVITDIPLRYFFYYQWLILGLYELELKKEVQFSIKPKSLIDLFFLRNYKIYLGARKYFKLFKEEKNPDYLLKGFVLKNGRRQDFCYDIADTPYYFNVDYLDLDIIYFKAQCPIEIKAGGFELTPEIKIPYHPVVLKNKDKIQPSMLGPIASFDIYSYKLLLEGYNKLFVNNIQKSGKLMCYFGGNKGPTPEFSYNPDLYLNELHILGYFGKQLNHPNEKRGIAARQIAAMGNRYDSRIIKEFTEGVAAPVINQQAFIPLADYTKHISRFNYNLNISGFRKSIPFRFIYSFSVGTAIITDKLSVKWYLPFESEVVETVEMGYLPNTAVDWDAFNISLNNLPELNATEILSAFQNKWAPKAFASYIVNTCINKLN